MWGGDAVELTWAALLDFSPRFFGELGVMLFVAVEPKRKGGFEEFTARLFAAFPDLDDDLFFLLGVDRFGAAFLSLLAEADFAVEGFDRMLAVPAEGVADLVDHRAPARTIATRVAGAAAFQIFCFAFLTHDPGKCPHPGVILSGAPTYLSIFTEAAPVSFNLAQCACGGNINFHTVKLAVIG